MQTGHLSQGQLCDVDSGFRDVGLRFKNLTNNKMLDTDMSRSVDLVASFPSNCTDCASICPSIIYASEGESVCGHVTWCQHMSTCMLAHSRYCVCLSVCLSVFVCVTMNACMLRTISTYITIVNCPSKIRQVSGWTNEHTCKPPCLHAVMHHHVYLTS